VVLWAAALDANRRLDQRHETSWQAEAVENAKYLRKKPPRVLRVDGVWDEHELTCSLRQEPVYHRDLGAERVPGISGEPRQEHRCWLILIEHTAYFKLGSASCEGSPYRLKFSVELACTARASATLTSTKDR
jgi:hypothetical protein